VLGIDNLSSGNLRNLEGAMKNVRFSLKQVELSKQDDLNQISGEFDFIFHLAALAEIVPSIQEPTRYFESNVVGTYNICQKARELNIKKIVYAASSSCYGIPDHYPTQESAEVKPQYPYALTKFLGEKILLHWNQVYKILAISLRLFNVYGPRARTSGSYGAVMGVFLAQMMANKPLTIVGDGEQLRDFTYVRDVVSAFYCAAIPYSLSNPCLCNSFLMGVAPDGRQFRQMCAVHGYRLREVF
jgi:UDP-glucose 4-epimerase